MKQNKSIPIIIILVACLISGWILYTKTDTPPNNPLTGPTISPDIKQVNMEDWVTYTNKKIGVEFRHPQKMVDGDNIEIFNIGNVLFVTTASSELYKRRDELNLPSQNAIFSKVKEINGTPYLDDWIIRIFDVKSKQGLNDIIQKEFGEIFPNGCKLGQIFPTEHEGVFDVDIDAVIPDTDPEDKNGSYSSCWINWRIGFKYSPVYHQAAYWDIGQEEHFPIECENHKRCEADLLMADSFRFIKSE